MELTAETPFQPLQVGDLLDPSDWSFHVARGTLLRVIGIRHQIVGPTTPKVNCAYGEVSAHTHALWVYTQAVDRAPGTPPPSKQAVPGHPVRSTSGAKGKAA